MYHRGLPDVGSVREDAPNPQETGHPREFGGLVGRGGVEMAGGNVWYVEQSEGGLEGEENLECKKGKKKKERIVLALNIWKINHSHLIPFVILKMMKLPHYHTWTMSIAFNLPSMWYHGISFQSSKLLVSGL